MTVPSEVAALLHAGLIDQTAWENGLSALTHMLEAHHLIALVAKADDVRHGDPVIWGAHLTKDQIGAFMSSSAELRNVAAQIQIGRALPTDSVVPDEVLYRSRFYHDAVRPAGGHHGMVVRPTGSALVVACRAQSAGSFPRAQVETLQAMLPTLEATLRLKTRLTRLEERSSMLERALDEVSDLGIFLMDRRGVVIHLNRAAERILEAADGLYWRRGELSGAQDADTARLQRALRDGSGELCALSRPSSRKPLIVRAVSTDPATVDPLQEIAPTETLLFVRDPDKGAENDFERIATALGLTRREARLAALLADGRSVAEAADETGITIGNARTHLKRIFNKTDTHRQAELVRLLFQAKP
jgi:DNA-binding CsgD family transcriptional regulator/PAS domain-containing protein